MGTTAGAGEFTAQVGRSILRYSCWCCCGKNAPFFFWFLSRSSNILMNLFNSKSTLKIKKLHNTRNSIYYFLMSNLAYAAEVQMDNIHHSPPLSCTFHPIYSKTSAPYLYKDSLVFHKAMYKYNGIHITAYYILYNQNYCGKPYIWRYTLKLLLIGF